MSEANTPAYEAPTDRRPKLLVVQAVAPPYRVDFFRVLGQSSVFRFRLCHGKAKPGMDLPSVPEIEGVETCPVENRQIKFRGGVEYQKGLFRQIRAFRPDVVVSEMNSMNLSSWFQVLAAPFLGYRSVLWGHGLDPGTSKRAAWLYKVMLSRASAGLLYSGPKKDDFVQMGVPASKLFVAWNSINTKDIERLRKAPEEGPRNRLVYIGRMIPFKKVTFTVRAFAKALPDLNPDTILTMIGGGVDLDECRALAKELGIESRVEFTGPVYSKDAQGRPAGAPEDMIAPYMNESFASVCGGPIGLNLVQVMAYGLPMIYGAEDPHPPEIAAAEPEVNCVTFTSDDEGDFARQMVRLDKDRALTASLAKGALKTIAERFNLSIMASGFEDAVRYLTQRG